jgi:hypothetical protein
MGFRETLNRNPVITTITLLLVIVVTTGFIISHSWQSLSSQRFKARKHAYFSIDDGKNFFKDDESRIAPFKTAEGKEAVRAVVYSCKGGKEPFVAWLERYTPEGRQKLEQLRAQMAGAQAPKTPDMAQLMAMQTAMEIKKPGEQEWVRPDDMRRFEQVRTVKCPEGSTQIGPVFPE